MRNLHEFINKVIKQEGREKMKSFNVRQIISKNELQFRNKKNLKKKCKKSFPSWFQSESLLIYNE